MSVLVIRISISVVKSDAWHVKLRKISLVLLDVDLDLLIFLFVVGISTWHASCRYNWVIFLSWRLFNTVNFRYCELTTILLGSSALNFNVWLRLKPVERLCCTSRTHFFQRANSVKLPGRVGIWISNRADICLVSKRLVCISRTVIRNAAPLTVEGIFCFIATSALDKFRITLNTGWHGLSGSLKLCPELNNLLLLLFNALLLGWQ